MPLTRRAVDNLLPLADMRPAFRDDALRMIGGLPGHPVTRAIRNGALRFDPPDWKDGHAALRYLASLLSNALTRVIADRKLPFKHLPNWDYTLPALNNVFGIDLHHHFLHAAPLEWLQKAWLTEPQITRGFAHCLNAGVRTTRTGRIRALLRALGSDPGDADSSLRDRHVLALVKQWLVAPVEESDGRGGWRRTTQAKDRKRGIPQGAPISPTLSNLYMRRFVLGWKVLGHERRLGAYIVNYADDFVICCRRGNAQVAMADMRSMMERLGLAVNEAKTGIRRIPEESVEFLGYTIGRCYSRQTGRAYVGTRPSKRSVRRAIKAVSRMTARRTGRWEAESLVGRLNRMLTGWGRYFCLGPVTPAYRAVDGRAGFAPAGCPTVSLCPMSAPGAHLLAL